MDRCSTGPDTQKGKVLGKRVRECGMDMYTQLYLKWTTYADLLHSAGNAAQCYLSLDRTVYANGYTVCMAGPPCCPPETITTLSLNLLTQPYKPFGERQRQYMFKSRSDIF